MPLEPSLAFDGEARVLDNYPGVFSEKVSSWHIQPYKNNCGKFLPLVPTKPCYNLRGECKAAVPKLKKDRTLDNLIEETKKVAINGPGREKNWPKKPLLKIEFETTELPLPTPHQNLGKEFKTPMLKNSLQEEHRPVFKPCVAKPVKGFTKEKLAREIFDEAMLDTSYSTNLAYHTSKTQKPQKKKSGVHTAHTSKIIRLKKSSSSRSSIFGPPEKRKPSIYDSLRKPNPISSNFRVNLSQNDIEGKRAIKFMGDLSNPNFRSTQNFHMVKGADRRDVQENIDRVKNEYLDEMLNKIADL